MILFVEVKVRRYSKSRHRCDKRLEWRQDPVGTVLCPTSTIVAAVNLAADRADPADWYAGRFSRGPTSAAIGQAVRRAMARLDPGGES